MAEARGYSIYWGTESFSIRALLASGQYASFVYSWLPNRFEFYFGYLPLSEQEVATLRQELMALGVFREAGRLTLRAVLDREVLSRIQEVYDFILNRMDEIVKAQ